MTTPPAAPEARLARGPLPLPPWAFAGFTIKAIAVIAIAWVTYQSLQTRERAVTAVADSLETIERLAALDAVLTRAETGQRGFLLTGEERYLEPFTLAAAQLPIALATLRTSAADAGTPGGPIFELEQLAADKMMELGDTVAVYRSGAVDEAIALVRTDRGKITMDRIRALLATVQTAQRDELTRRQALFDEAVSASSRITWLGSLIVLSLIVAVAVVTSRDYRMRRQESWLRAGLATFRARIQGEHRLERLGAEILAFFAESLQVRVGTVSVVEDGGFRQVASYALADPAAGGRAPGGGLAVQSARDNRTLHVTDVPDDYFQVSSSVGATKPRELVIVPAVVEGVTQSVVELGFLRRVTPVDLDLVARVAESLGIAFRTSRDRSQLEDLLARTQMQAEELQTQQEELRVTNEELEEQAKALRESQARLESQQVELEQINANLEEQTQLLEIQKDHLANSELTLAAKAAELERANQYKSEFLANMSHELRTPLNSSLILAKLLSDNREGNLTDEQVRFARTIASAGHDLLALINDILDLSRIEAGRVDITAEAVAIGRLVEEQASPFAAIAREKGLDLQVSIAPAIPEQLQTDPRRLGQILKNLLANAVKFTDRGRVSLHVAATADGRIAFAVRDTGIGIPPHQQGLIFEAFRQADGSTHRKYGGTGLGLAISRDLARLLGGDLEVTSVAGEGSTFTLTIPVAYSGLEPQRLAPSAPLQGSRPPIAAPAPRPRPAEPVAIPDDDRAHLAADARLILVVEDDPHFAAILRDLAHELGFQCIVAHSANEGLGAAIRFRPSAIVLDVNLPDHSGLGVLDQLKRNPDTRHIPVHMASVDDFAHEALERGAIGYAVKPVQRSELIQAFRNLEAKFSQRVRRVLVVEDDARQRDGIRQLLASDDVEILTVGDAGGALAQLRSLTFDCVVMDLNLPDMSGYELLEDMAQQDGGSFPPVIVYTARSLTRDEEQRIQRFSRSIIIKDARSPERLLDEVTLFLHQVESSLPAERQRMLRLARDRESTFEGRRILVVEDDARNIFALSSVLEPKGARVEIARNGREGLDELTKAEQAGTPIDLVLMDIMMPEMDGLTAIREIRTRPAWKRLPIIALTAKAMKDDQERCLAAGANDYIAKPLDVEKLLSLVRVWLPK